MVAAVALSLLTVPAPALAADSSYRTLSAANHPDWLSDVSDATSLAALSIPDTHETMSIHGGALTQTQEDFGDSGGTLARQLSAGLRMIDIRARVNQGNEYRRYRHEKGSGPPFPGRHECRRFDQDLCQLR